MKMPELLKRRLTLKRVVVFCAWTVFGVGLLLPAAVPGHDIPGHPFFATLTIIVLSLLGACLIFLPERFDLIHKGEGWKTFFLVLTGYLLSGVLAVWSMTDIHYQNGIGTFYPITKESIFFGMILTVLCGFLIPSVCFWFKFYRWWLAWTMMVIISVGLGFADWYFEKCPEVIIRQTFGKYADDLKIEAFVVNSGYESSYKAFRMKGDVTKFQETLQKSFPDGQKTEYVITDRLPEFMRSSQPVVFNWFYSNFLHSWKTADGQYYLLMETWNSSHFRKWERMILETKP